LHICYQRAVRRHLRRQADKSTALNSHDFKRQLKNMGIAYNVLYDPRTRLDYDLRQLGLREPDCGTGLIVPADAKLPEAGGKAKVAFSELLIVCRIFDFEQMLAIVNAARLLDEQRFWAYLGDSGLLTGVELDSIKTGFQFICNGLISIYQFEQAFQYARTHQQQLLEILLAAGWVRLDDLQEFANADMDALPEAPKFVEANVKRQEAPVAAIQVSATLPSWMEWGSEDNKPPEANDIQAAPEPEGSAPQAVPEESVPEEPEGPAIDFANMAKIADASLKHSDTSDDSADMIQSVPAALSEALSAAQAQFHADDAEEDSTQIEVPHSLEEELSAAQTHAHDEEPDKSDNGPSE
jgi:hypothetical protein